MDSFQEFLEPIALEREQMENLLIEWCNINSGSYNLDGLANMLNTLEKAFTSLPGNPERIPLSPIQIIHKKGNYTTHDLGNAFRMRCRPDAPIQILFNGHMDTVYGKEHPFQKCRKLDDNKLQGPGVTDMKGGLVVMLKALQAFEKTPWAQNVGWQILICPDEEIGSPGSTILLKEAAKHHLFALAFESSPPNGLLARARKGSFTFAAIAEGRSGHAGRDFPKTRNAIVLLSEFVTAVHNLNKELSDCIFNVAHIEGGGPPNTVPDKATAVINVRISHLKDEQLIKQKLEALVKSANQKEGFKLHLSTISTRPPKEITPAIETLFKHIQGCGNDLGLNLDWEDTGGASDGNTLAHAGLPNIDNIGVRGDNIHSTHEYALLDSLVERAQLTCLFLIKIASGSISLPNDLFPDYPTLS